VAVFPPVGLLTIAAVLEKNGYEPVLIDADAENLSLDEAVDRTVQINPDFAGLTTMTATMDISADFYSRLKAKLPDVRTIAGGPHVSAVPELTLEQFKDIDVVVIGEGDEAIVPLLQAMEQGKDLDPIPGLAFRRNGNIVRTAHRPPIDDLGRTSIPAFHLLEYNLYRSYGWNSWVSGYREPLGVVSTGRGCYGKCNFCASHCVFGDRIRFYPIERIKREIDLLVEKYNIRTLYFQDDTFTANRRIVNSICDYLIEKGYSRKLEIMVSARADVVHLPTLKKMRQAGIQWICFGIESGSQKILDQMGKNITIQQIRDAVRSSREAGLFVAGNYMVGHIGETWETAMETINLACELDQDYASFAIAIPFPGTGLYQHCLDNSIPLPTWNDFGSVNTPPIPLNSALNADDLLKLRATAISKFFKRPHYLLRLFRRFNAIAVIKDFSKMWLAMQKERRAKRF
jgi:anaerobic magnesium-protoporphyrin IX monomethyl ester cyclase